jgi:uncharacterized protein YecE (DUF72 family)
MLMVDLLGDPLPAPDACNGSTVVNADKRTPKKAATIAAATPMPEAVLLRQSLPSLIHFGTSSWSFAGWQGLVYASCHSESQLSRAGLSAYSAHPLLRAVSLDRTFYAPLSEAEYQHYARQVPPHFRFLVKAPMALTSSYLRTDDGRFTDSPFYLDVNYAIDSFIAPATAGLGRNVGPLVFQFPPQGKHAVAEPDAFINRLYRFLRDLPPGIRYAVEVRNRELLTTRFFKCLETTQTQFCIASHAAMPSPASQIQLLQTQAPALLAGDFICRWSLHAGFKYEDAKARYYPFDKLVDEDVESRHAIADAIASATKAGKTSIVTINNKAEGSAPLSVLRLAEAVRTRLF